MSNYYQYGQIKFKSLLSPISCVQSPNGRYVILESFSQALAYDVSDYVSDSYIVHLKLDGKTYTTCLKYDFLTNVLGQLPVACIRGRALSEELFAEGLATFIDLKTGILTSPLDGSQHQLFKTNGQWCLTSEVMTKLLGITAADLEDTIDSVRERQGR